MRTAFFLLFFAILYTQASIGYSQGAELSLDLKSASIKEICEKLKGKVTFGFSSLEMLKHYPTRR